MGGGDSIRLKPQDSVRVAGEVEDVALSRGQRMREGYGSGTQAMFFFWFYRVVKGVGLKGRGFPNLP